MNQRSTERGLIAGALGAWAIVALWANGIGCGHVPPKPPADCAAACAHLQALDCATSVELCDRLCSSVVGQDPAFADCVAAAGTCAAADACQ